MMEEDNRGEKQSLKRSSNPNVTEGEEKICDKQPKMSRNVMTATTTERDDAADDDDDEFEFDSEIDKYMKAMKEGGHGLCVPPEVVAMIHKQEEEGKKHRPDKWLKTKTEQHTSRVGSEYQAIIPELQTFDPTDANILKARDEEMKMTEDQLFEAVDTRNIDKDSI